ncbi:uncharacterized protein IL334_007452 [Kwoniella shivajii]|uniref:BHLH domain-containing protein n=1 Tax=Kwoniella shivajii TaxID=564305 RepID=A0ABZ1DAJ3_9TREE|nr:hypothetical protein IL334_007452 [Kwoniella shivajii]
MPPPSDISRRRKHGPPPIAPKQLPLSLLQQSSPSASVSSLSVNQDDDYVPQSSSTRRGSSIQGKRKQPPAQSSTGRPNKTSREAMRKANHSLIERRRREKINAALSELRRMVPGLGDDGGKAGEFKLESLTEHIEILEGVLRENRIPVPQTVQEDGNNGKSGKLVNQPESPTRTRDEIPINPHSHAPSSFSHYSHINRCSLSTHPSPGNQSDPNETEIEPELPPPFAKASHLRPSSSMALASLLGQTQHSPSPPLSRPPPSPRTSNTIYLPFPAPSPTSPFLNGSSNSSASTVTGPPDPSPFLAPLSGMSLFGGVLDPVSPADSFKYITQHSPPHMSLPPTNRKTMPPEEAANLLLAFSSPDTLRPQIMNSRGVTLDNDDFKLDVPNAAAYGKAVLRHVGHDIRVGTGPMKVTEEVTSKSAQDFLGFRQR